MKIRVTRVGYRVVESVYVAVSRFAEVSLRIGLHPVPVELEGVTVEAPRTRDHERFLQRQRRGFGKYLGPEDLAKLKAPNTPALLFQMPGAFVFPDATGRGLLAHPTGGTTAGGGGLGGARPAAFCTPPVYVDGWRVDATIPLDAVAPPAWVRAVEVYRDPQNAPAEFRDSSVRGACPIIVIWTKFGFGDFER